MLIDYTKSFPEAFLVQGLDDNVLIIRKLDTPFKRADGKMAGFEIEHRWLSCICEHEEDEAWACVKGSDFTYWQRKEIKSLVDGVQRGSAVNAFSRFFLM